MKRLLLITFLSIGAISVSAQSRFGARAGVNLSKINLDYADPNIQIENKFATSFQVGAYAEFKLLPKIFVQPGLELSGHGSKIVDGQAESKLNLMYLKVPLHFGTRVGLGLGSISFGAGPYFSYALSGRSSSGGQDTDIKFGNGIDDDLKRTDFGINLFSSYQLPLGLNFTLGYQMGLSNNLPSDLPDQMKAKNSSISFSVGYAIKLP